MPTLVRTFHELTRSLPEAVLLVSPHGEIIAANASASKLADPARKELTGLRLTDLVAEPAEKVLRYLQVCSRNRDQIPGTLTWRTNDHGGIECRCRGSVIHPGEEEDSAFLVLLHCEPKVSVSNRFIALNKTLEELRASHYKLMVKSELLSNEIAERKKLEEQLFQSQKMEAVGQLAGGIAHDFNNILTAIIGFGSLLGMKMKHNDPLRLYVEEILVSSERASGLTRQLLAFSRKQIINLAVVDLNEIIRNVERLLLRLIGEEVELRSGLSRDDLNIMADSGQIEQIMMNLATNAKDAMHGRGLLLIETARVEFDEQFIRLHPQAKPGVYALLSVTDSGAGMAEDTRERIFDPFFTTKEPGKGTGLGLAVVYGIVKQHSGFIDVYSEPGTGTTFKIYFPLAESPRSGGKSKETITPRGGTETILVVEDNTEVRVLMRHVLEEFGYHVVEAVDGEDAVAQFERHKDMIRLVVLDVIMPRKSGKEAYDEIKRISPGVRILFTSGYAADMLSRKGIVEEGIDLVSKPVTPMSLLSRVRELLDRNG